MNNTQTVDMKELIEKIDFYVSTTFKDGVYRAYISGTKDMVRVYQLNKNMGITNSVIENLKEIYNLKLVAVGVDRYGDKEQKDCVYALFEVTV